MAETAERADDLVRDEEHAVLVTDLADPWEIALRRDETTTRVLDRLEENCSDGLGPFEEDAVFDALDEPIAERSVVLAERMPVPVGARYVRGPGCERFEWRADRRDTGDGERAEGGAVVRRLSRDDLVPLALALGAEVLARQLPGRLDGFTPAGGEEHPVQIAGCQRGELGREFDRGGVAVAPDREVLERLGLFRGRLGEVMTTVAKLHSEQAAQRVQVLAFVRVPEVAAFAAHHDRNLLGLVGAEPSEVHPEMAAGLVVEIVDVVGGHCETPCWW